MFRLSRNLESPHQWRLQIARNRGPGCMHAAVPGQPWWPSCFHHRHLHQIASWWIPVQVCRPISHCLIMSQQGSVDEYNRIVHEQFDQHRIVTRLDAVNKMTRYRGFPAPNFLRAMIIKLYRQMTEIRIHEKKCRKILQPDSDYSPTVQMWYNRIHAYLQLIRL